MLFAITNQDYQYCISLDRNSMWPGPFLKNGKGDSNRRPLSKKSQCAINFAISTHTTFSKMEPLFWQLHVFSNRDLKLKKICEVWCQVICEDILVITIIKVIIFYPSRKNCENYLKGLSGMDCEIMGWINNNWIANLRIANSNQ
jgi:hypothetical protein